MQTAKEMDCEAIIQLGDNMYMWPTDNRLDRACEILGDMVMYWIDGNHDWHPELVRLGAWPHVTEPVVIRENFIYLPRGIVWEQDGVNFLTMGGAHSVDARHRTEGKSVWAEEERIHNWQIAKALDAAYGKKIDVMLTHDGPETHHVQMNVLRQPNSPFNDERSAANRQKLMYLAERVKPKMLFHGHFHMAYREEWGPYYIIVEGLDKNGDLGYSWTVFDTEFYKERYR